MSSTVRVVSVYHRKGENRNSYFKDLIFSRFYSHSVSWEYYVLRELIAQYSNLLLAHLWFMVPSYTHCTFITGHSQTTAFSKCFKEADCFLKHRQLQKLDNQTWPRYFPNLPTPKYMQFQSKLEVTADDTCIKKSVIILWQELSELSNALGDVLMHSLKNLVSGLTSAKFSFQALEVFRSSSPSSRC